MAKLNPKDPQFGIPVAARTRKEIAFDLNERAKKAGKSFSRYLSEHLEKADANEKKVAELTKQLEKELQTIKAKEQEITKLQAWLAREKEQTKAIISRFIIEISKGNQKQANQLIQTYNTILKDEKSK
jgi:hypothetical protein